jgi:predicted Holliday junction resolvase-like endonuclease
MKERAQSLKKLRKSISLRSEVGAKAVNIGFILERLAPSMKTFRFEHNDCRSLFDPIDYLIFEGLTLKQKVDRILFVDIKTGGARLKSTQKEIKELVGRKKVRWDLYSPEV